ncbi:coiled-coil domain-containing protein 130 homolog [Sitodiplosis mosellana]|uniref:coiled-coil domain-containing protein 130 homolog n=1 Tax=Sitodiplosis mosellana TaxID=263140 RepID=UPI0024439633|nr:coiled-coil domain-containing protein 130 homolog [Sitodiplosis mosellana]
MGERKGQNKYYPPDYDPRAGGLNKFLGTHALRERARKIHLGIIIIRFEMPYNIWCEGCKNHIGMGVRYNAEKTKVGMYYSTPVYQFKMKCHLCDNYIVIKTDPGNLDYEIVSGARRQENRWDPTENGQVVPDTKETQRRLFDDPMYKLEHVASDSKKCDDAKPALYKLYERNHYTWDDDYMANSKLRAEFRNKKKELKLEADKDKALLSRSSLDIELLPENDQDTRLAAMMRLQSERVINEKDRKEEMINRPALPAIKAISNLRSQRLLNTKLTKNDLGIKRKSDESNEDSTKRSKPAETVTKQSLEEKSEEDPSISIDSMEEKMVDVADKNQTSENSLKSPKVPLSLSLVRNYCSDSSSDDNDNAN